MTTQYQKIDVRDPLTGEVIPVSPQKAARLCGVCQRTAERWARHGRMPEPCRRLLTILALGLLPDRQWWRFRVRGDQLYQLDGPVSVTPGEIQGVHAAWAEADALRRRVRDLEGGNGRRVEPLPIKKPASG